MDIIKLGLHNIKNIKDANLEIPFENGVYTFVGGNGCGKSTIMLCLAQIISKIQLNKLTLGDIQSDSYISVKTDVDDFKWYQSIDSKWECEGIYKKYDGFYEGSLFYGTRFEDSTNIESKIVSGQINDDYIADADDFVKDQLSFILHGDTNHYRTLKRIKNKYSARNLGITNRPYFIKSNDTLISQYRMSSGECMLISLLHFLYNSIVRKSIPIVKKALVMIDEIELALHPIAILRLIDFLKDLVNNHKNLIIYLSSHSPEVIRSIRPSDLFKVNNNDGIVTIESNCYPSYLIRDLYSNISPDYLLLVEDKLAQLVVDNILSRNNFRIGKLIHCVPVGGWKNVLELHSELLSKNVLGTNTKIISILDGDVEGLLNKNQKRLHHLFLPIKSVEKFLYSVIKKNENPSFRRLLKDKYFIVSSLDEIVSNYNKRTMTGAIDNDKNFYHCLIGELNKINITEENFIAFLCNDIVENMDISSFVSNIAETLSNNVSNN